MKLYPDIYRKILRIGLKSFLHMYLDLRYGQETLFPPGPKVFAVNHPTVWDAFPILSYVKHDRMHTLVEEQIWSFSVPKLLFTLSNQVVLYRDQRSSESIADSLFLLSEGRSLLIAPEGERTAPTARVRAKRGVARLAIEGRAAIVPVGVWIDPANIVMKSVGYRHNDLEYSVDSYFPRFRARYGVMFGVPMFFDDEFGTEPDLDRLQEISTDVLETIYTLSERARDLFGPNPVTRHP